MNVHDQIAYTREKRDRDRATILANLEADLAEAVTHADRLAALDRACKTLTNLEPRQRPQIIFEPLPVKRLRAVTS